MPNVAAITKKLIAMRLSTTKTFLLLLSICLANNCHAELSYMPYVGLEFQLDPVRFNQNELGVAKFKTWTPQERLFIGMKFNENFAAEVGYEFSARTKKEVTLGQNQTFLGRTTDAIDDGDTHQLEYKYKAINLNLIGIYPILSTNFSLLSYLGFSKVRVSAYDLKIAVDGIHANPIESENLYSKSKFIPHLGAGLEWKPKQNLALRVSGIWQNKGRLDSLSGTSSANHLNAPISATMKNNLKYTLTALVYI